MKTVLEFEPRASGIARGKVLFHAVAVGTRERSGGWSACGFAAARHWGGTGDKVDCPKCLRILKNNSERDK